MADNVPITPGSGAASVASDDVSGAQYQRIKITDGADGGTSSMLVSSDGSAHVSVIGTPVVSVAGGGIDVDNFPTNQNVSGSVVSYQQGTWRVSTIGGSTGNSSVQVLNFPTNQNVSGSVAAFQGTDPWTVDGTVSANQAGTQRVSVVSSTPSSMLVGASIVGLPPVNVTNTVTVDATGQGDVPVTLGNERPSISGTVNTVQTGAVRTSVSGTVTVDATSSGDVPVTLDGENVNIGNFPTTQNVSGSVAAFQKGTYHTSIVSTVPSSVLVGASVYGIPNPLVITGSVQGAGGGTQYSEDSAAPADPTGTAAALVRQDTPSVLTSADGDIVAQRGTNYGAAYAQIVTSSGDFVDSFGGGSGTNSVIQQGAWRVSVVSSTPSSLLVGASIIGRPPVNVTNFPTTQNVSGSVAAFVQGTPNVNTAGSVVAFQGTDPWIIKGSVQGTFSSGPVSGSSVVQQGTWRASVVSSTPSSMLVGASIFGLPPVNVTNTNLNVSGSIAAFVQGTPNVNTAGSVVAFQGTDPWIIKGSVQGSFSPSGNQSVSGTVGASVIGTVPVTQSGTNVTSLVSTIPSSIQVGASVMGHAPVVIIGGSVATATTNSSVMLLRSSNNIGSVTTLQGTNPWTIGGNVGQTGTIRASVVSSVPSSMLVGASVYGNVGISGTPTFLQLAGSILATSATVTPAANQSVSGTVGASVIGLAPVTVNNVPETSVHGTIKVFPASVISGHGSVNGVASVQILAAPGAGLYNYVTDFLLSNTGAATTLVEFTDGDGSVMGKSIAPTGGGAVATNLATPFKTLQSNKVVNISAPTATSVLHGWIGGYKAP